MRKAELISKQLSVVMAAVLFATQLYAVVGGPDLPDPGRTSMTREQQIQAGAQVAAQVYKQMPVLPDSSPETQYVRQLGQKLVATIPSQYSWPFQFHVVAQKEINAFALPGGEMFINVGTITAAANEAELAAVMAHEMAHVYMMHSAKSAGKEQTTAALGGLLGAIAGAALGGTLGSLAQLGINTTARGFALRYSRADEAQADAVGAIIMYKAGYNPQAMADFFQRLAEQGDSGLQLLSDHPNPGNREQAIQKEIANWPRKQYNTSNAAFLRVKQQADKVKAYAAQQIADGARNGQWAAMNQRNGSVFQPPAGVAVSQSASAGAGTIASNPAPLQSVLPSSKLVTANLGPLSIARPENWQVLSPGQKGGDVMIAPQAGISRSAVGYGVALNALQAQNRQLSLDQVTEDLVRNYESQGDMRALGDAQPITVGGVQGRSVTLQSTSPFPDDQGNVQKEQDWLVTLPRSDGAVLYLVFVAPQSQFDRFRPTFENMLQSVRF